MRDRQISEPRADNPARFRLPRQLRFAPSILTAVFLATACAVPGASRAVETPTPPPPTAASPTPDALNPHPLIRIYEGERALARDPIMDIAGESQARAEVIFYYDDTSRDNRPGYAADGSLMMRICVSGDALAALVSEQVTATQTEGPGFTFKDDVTRPRVFKGTNQKPDCKTLRPITGLRDGEKDRIYLGISSNPGANLGNNMKTYETERAGNEVNGTFTGLNTLDIPNIKLRETPAP